MKSKALELADYQNMRSEVRSLMRTEAEFRGAGITFEVPHMNRYWEYGSVLAAMHEAGVKERARVLDVGSGNGPLGPWLARLGYRVDEIDPDSAVVGRTSLIPHLKDNDWAFASISLFEFKPGSSYDVVASVSVMEHIPEESQQDAWGRLVSLVKPGGLLVVTVDYGDEKAANSHARAGIFTPETMPQIISALENLGIKFDEIDTEFKGEQVYNYTFFRLVGRKVE